MAIVDTATLEIVASVETPAMPIRVAMSPDGRIAYVTCAAGSALLAIDVASRAVVATHRVDLPLAPGAETRQFAHLGPGTPLPIGLVVSPSTGAIYLAATMADRVEMPRSGDASRRRAASTSAASRTGSRWWARAAESVGRNSEAYSAKHVHRAQQERHPPRQSARILVASPLTEGRRPEAFVWRSGVRRLRRLCRARAGDEPAETRMTVPDAPGGLREYARRHYDRPWDMTHLKGGRQPEMRGNPPRRRSSRRDPGSHRQRWSAAPERESGRPKSPRRVLLERPFRTTRLALRKHPPSPRAPPGTRNGHEPERRCARGNDGACPEE